MSALGPGLFYVSTLIAVAGALATVCSRSPIRSAMSLLISIIGVAGLYLTLSAQLLAAVQLIVYAGAVVVLFVFVIMMMGPTPAPAKDNRTLTTRAVAVVGFAAAAIGALVLLLRAPTGGPHTFDPTRVEFGTVFALGRAVFSDGLVAFELTGVLLLVAIVAVMAIARSTKPDRQAVQQPIDQNTQKELSS